MTNRQTRGASAVMSDAPRPLSASTIILDTVHGSRLYGLAHADSDHDVFRVVYSRRKALVSFRDGLDYREFSFAKFLEFVFKGSHQSCEALFSPLAYMHPDFAPMLRAMHVTGPEAFAAYRRTIRAFAHGDAKKRRHAVRLGLNLRDLRASGRFNPRLTPTEVALVGYLASTFEGDQLADRAMDLP